MAESERRSRFTPAYVAGYAVALLVGALFVWYFWKNSGDFHFLTEASPTYLGAAAVCLLCSYILNSQQLSLFLNHFKSPATPLESFALTTAMILGNSLTPMRGGSGGLAIYLKTVHKMDFSAFAAIYGGTAILVTLINTALATLGLVFMWIYHSLLHVWLTVAVVGLFGASLYLSLWPPPMNENTIGIRGFLSGSMNSWRDLTRNRMLLLKLALSLTVTTFAVMGAFFFIYKAIAAEVSFSGVLVISSLGTVANLAPITPGSLGFVEVVTVNVPHLFNVDLPRAVAAAAIYRVSALLLAVVCGAPGALYLFKRRVASKKRGSR